MASGGELTKRKIALLTVSQLSRRIQPMTRKRVKLTDQLRQAIDTCGKSRYQVGQETGIDPATLCRFMHKQGGLSMDGLDLIADCLGLNITTGSKPRKPKGTRTKGR